MKAMYPLALVMATAALLGSSVALRASESDDRIESSFKNSVVYKTFLKDENIKISSKDGAVTLSGAVSEVIHKRIAQDTAEALPEVKSVDNRIVLLNVDAGKTDVSVKDDGIRRVAFARGQTQKEQTTEYAKDVEGFKEVSKEASAAKASEKPAETLGKSINDASISIIDPSASINDASITAQVKKSLSSDRLTRALDTKVTTSNGTVLIGGKASNGAQRDLVTKLVTGVNGVKSVVNHMIIEETMTKND